jgi:peptidoglycan/xylan/chitin deacetylase (PgdA/CDA1 family)
MVLTYHTVGPSPLGLPLEHFCEQMQWLRENAAVVSVENLLSGRWPNSRSGIVCAITFDDGYASVYRWAYPVLEELGLPATVYLVVDAIGQTTARSSNEFAGLYPDEEMLRWREVKEMHEHEITPGSHLLRHKDLTCLNRLEAKEELEGSKKAIENRVGAECSSFCYPWGRHDTVAVEAVKAAGYRDAVTAIQGRWRADESLDWFRIPRADIRREYSIEDFAAVVRGDWDYLGYVQRLRRIVN